MKTLYGFDITNTSNIPFVFNDCAEIGLPKLKINICDNISFVPTDYYKCCKVGEGLSYYSEKFVFLESMSYEKMLVTSDEINLVTKNDNIGALIVSSISMGMLFASRLHSRAVQHGGAFVHDSKAYLVIAQSGVGKSTFCSSMRIFQNTPIISDDILSISSCGRYTYNGLHMLKLVPDDLRKIYNETHLMDEQVEMLEIHPNQLKWLCHWNDNTCLPMYPIGGIIFLMPHEGSELISINELNSIQSFQMLTQNIKMRATLSPAMLINELDILKELSAVCPAYQISIKRDYGLLPQITENIMRIIS